MKTQIPDQKF
jgi:hypothetical protein